MGCKGSKESAADKKIDSEFKHTKLPKFDEIFDKASTILQNCEKIREGLEDTRDEAERLTNTDKLKDPKFLDSLQILLWSLSSEGQGKISNVGVTVDKEVPYLALNESKLSEENKSLYEQFKNYVKTVVESPDDLKSSVEKLQELANLIPDATKNAKADIEASGLNFKEKAEALVNVSKNGAKLPKELAKCQNLATLLKDAGADLKDIIPKLPSMVSGADTEGSKLHADNVKKLADIFEKTHKGERKAAEGTDKKKEEKKDNSPQKKEKASSPQKKDQSPEKKEKAPETQAQSPEKKEQSPEKKEHTQETKEHSAGTNQHASEHKEETK